HATVLPTLVSVPVTKNRLGIWASGERKYRSRSRQALCGHANRVNQLADLFDCDRARERETNARSAGGNRRRTDGFHRVAIDCELRCNLEGGFIPSGEDRNDLRLTRSATDTGCREAIAKPSRNLFQVRPLATGFANQAQSRSNLPGHVTWHGRAENERPTIIDQV